MLKRDITFTNPFTEEEVTETHYFHISKADLVEMEMEEHNAEYEKDGQTLTGMQAKLQRIVDSNDGKAIMAEFKDMIRRSYGKKDGNNFRKSDAIWDEFSSTEAYSQLFFELCTDSEQASRFINGVVPRNLEQIAEEVRQKAAAQAAAAQSDPTGLTTPTPAPETTAPSAPTTDNSERKRAVAEAMPENPIVLTRIELVEMDDEVLKAGLADGRYKLS